ncbi:unnamed protein product [Musa textilis]
MASVLDLLCLLFLVLLLSSSPVSSGECNKDDKKALLAIKKALGDPYVLIAWTSQYDCCDWVGVHCNETTSRVTSLDIGDTNTSFAIPSAVAHLPFLTSLTFHKNPGLTGPIPPAIGTMTDLTFLRLDWNSLSGPVPDFLSHLTRLDYLNLAFNQFSGAIPASLAALPLGYLAIDHNRLTGPIPESLARSPAAYLYLSNNNLTGSIPPSFASNTFERIDLSRNQLSGDAAHLFGRSKPLQLLDLSRNHAIEFNITQVEIPEEMTALDLNHNRIYGRLPPEMGKVEWQLLNVSYNQLCGPIPSGERIQSFDRYAFFHNKCLCGPPLPACK